MAKKIIDESPDLTVEYSFPKLSELKDKEFTIIYEHFYPKVGDGGLIDFKILSVEYFRTYEDFQNYIVSLIEMDYSSFISSLFKKSIEFRIGQIDSLIEDLENYKYYTIEKFTYKEIVHYKFRKAGLAGTRFEFVREDSNLQRKIFSLAEPFVLAFIEVIKQLIDKLVLLKVEIERNIIIYGKNVSTITQYRESFRYINYSRKTSSEGYKNMLELFRSLKIKGYIPENTNKDDFLRIFSGLEIFNCIVWLKDISSLHHFVKKLRAAGKLKDAGNRHYKLACNCFVDENGVLYNADKLSDQKSPKETEQIDKLVALL